MKMRNQASFLLRYAAGVSIYEIGWGGPTGGLSGGRIQVPKPTYPKILFLLGFRPLYFENLGKTNFLTI